MKRSSGPRHRSDHHVPDSPRRSHQQAISNDDLERKRPMIESCEERLALSGSLAADALLGLADFANPDLDDPTKHATDLPPTNPSADAMPIEVSTASATSSLNNSASTGSSFESDSIFEQAARVRETTGFSGAGQTIAVIDSGIAFDHVSLGGGFGPGFRVVGGFDFAENDSNPFDDGPAGFHGTQVSSILAGQSDNFSGIAPEADLVALRVFNDQGASELSYIESALRYVHDNQDAFESPITTVNLSVGAVLTDANRAEAAELLSDELELLRQDNILVFAAAGNFFDLGSGDLVENDEVLFPASEPSVVAVTSVSPDGTLSDFAQREAGIFATPGENINGAVPDHVFGLDGNPNDFARLDGTSQAAPQLAAASVLVRQSLIDQGIEPTADAVLERLDALTESHTDSVTGLTFRVPNLDRLADFAATETPTEPTNTPNLGDTDVIHRFTGTDDREDLELDFRNGLNLRTDSQIFSVEPSSAGATIVIDASGGNDNLVIQGSEAAERLILYPGDDGVSRLSTNDLEIELRGFESVTFIGGGGPDRASLFDSTGNDTLTSQPRDTTFSGTGFQFDIIDVNQVFVHATGGGNDTAFLSDSAADDQLAIRPQFTSLRGDDTFQLAFGFERVFAYATAGGDDSIEINDSTGDDTLSLSANRTVIAGPGYNVTTSGFESTIANAVSGGNDTARIFVDDTSSDWEVTEDRIELVRDDGAIRSIRGFERTEAFENFRPINLLTQSLPTESDEFLGPQSLLASQLGDPGAQMIPGTQITAAQIPGTQITADQSPLDGLDASSSPLWPDPTREAAASRSVFEALGESLS